MTEFTVIAYEKEDGESPVEDFINGLAKERRADYVERMEQS